MELSDNQYRAYTQGARRLVELDAKRKGWTVDRYRQCAERRGCVPFGVVLSWREPVMTALGPDQAYMVHEWALHEDGVVLFYSGSYDLSYRDAYAEFERRMGMRETVTS